MKFKSLLITILLSGITAWLHPACAFDFHVSTPQEFQAALSAAGTNGGDDSIFLAAGTYVGNFKYQPAEEYALTIKPEEGTAAGQVVLDGNNLAYVLMLNAEGKAADFVLEGLVLQNGNSSNGGGLHVNTKGDVSIENCAFEKNTASSSGGGAYISSSSLTFSNNRVSGNNGTGIYSDNSSAITFTDNIITGNSGNGVDMRCSSPIIFTDNIITGNSGNGVYMSGSFSTITFSNNTVNGNFEDGVSMDGYYSTIIFSNNTVNGNYRTGVSMSGSDSTTTFSNNTVSGNYSGVIYYDSSSLTFINNTVTESSSYGVQLYFRTGNIRNNTISKNTYGVFVMFSTLYFINNSITEHDLGGINMNMQQTDGLLHFINNTVSANKTGSKGGGVYFKLPDTTGTLHVYNNIIWGNTAPGEGDDIYVEGYGAETNFYNNTYADMKAIWDNQGGNKTLDPQFFDPDNGDFHLKPTSPCIDAGHPGAPELPATDMEGNARVGIADMGAYEHSTTALHPADTNQNWILELSEFNAYNTAWRNSTDWTVLPNSIPMDYVTRAGYLNKSGGTYRNTGSNRPLCWTPGSK